MSSVDFFKFLHQRMCAQACIYACMYVCIVRVCMSIVCLCVCVFVCVCVCVSLLACMCVHTSELSKCSAYVYVLVELIHLKQNRLKTGNRQNNVSVYTRV